MSASNQDTPQLAGNMSADELFKQFAGFSQILAGKCSDNRFADAWNKFVGALASNPEAMTELFRTHTVRQSEMLMEIAKSGNGAEPADKPANKDRRFAHEKWTTNPFYRYLRENYELNSKLLREASAQVELDETEQKAVDFIIEQLISAMAPTNYASTNPEVIDATLESGGKNLQRGFENYLHDLQKGAISHTPPGAFTIGETVATTAGKVVFQNHLMQLIEYAPTTAKVNAKPLLVVPPCINKYYILDLSEHNSLIKYLVDSGNRVFLISWVNAAAEHAQLEWDDYVASGVIEAIDIVGQISKQAKVHTLGYCIGGTLLACALSVMKSNKQNAAASMSLLTSFLDFCDTGTVGLFVERSFVDGQDEKFRDGGLFSGLDLQRTFAYLRPDDLVWPYVVRNYMLGETPAPFDILHWNGDATNLPGKMYAWYLRRTYLENDLKNGKIEVCGSKVRFDNLALPGMVIATQRDHIVPWQAAYASALLLGDKIDFVLASSGHVAGIVSPPTKKKGHYQCAKKSGVLPKNPQQWVKGARHVDGSWWDRYVKWLNKSSSGKVAAAKQAGNYKFRPLQDAPGTYVSSALPPIN